MIVFVLLLVSVLCWNHACSGSISGKNSRPILRRYWYYGSQRKTVRFEKYFLGGFLVYQVVFTQNIFWRLSINQMLKSSHYWLIHYFVLLKSILILQYRFVFSILFGLIVEWTGWKFFLKKSCILWLFLSSKS